MNKVTQIIKKIFPEFDIELCGLISENYKVLYTYIGTVEGINLKVSFCENTLQSASILLACEYNDSHELTNMKDVIDYMKMSIELENKEEKMKEIHIALREAGIEMPQNCTMDLVIGTGTKIMHIV